MKLKAGFTLIELVVALAIVVVASGLVLLRITGWSSRQTLHASARSLGNSIRTWRERARTEETTVALTFEGDHYQFAAGKEILRRGHLGTGEMFEAGSGTLVFSARGILPESRIALRNASGERVILILGTLLNEIDYEEAR